MSLQKKLILLTLINLFFIMQSSGQDTGSGIRKGFDISFGTQQMFPYNNKNYSRKVKGIKFVLSIPLNSRRLAYELQIEPSYFAATQQLLNADFIQPSDGADYLEKRALFTQKRIISEYTINIGFVTRYHLKDNLSIFLMASIGPLYTNCETERLAKGFAFSDIAAFGVAYDAGRVRYEIRPGVRHVSNADLQKPNSGHNTATIDFAITFLPKRR